MAKNKTQAYMEQKNQSYAKQYGKETTMPETEVKVRSWKLGCKTKGDTYWAYNALRFKTREECLTYGADLYSRWTALDTFEAHESEDEPNQ